MYLKRFLEETNNIKNKDSKTIINETTKGTLVGSAIGAGIGLFIGFSRKKNLLLSAFVGSLVGGVTTNIFLNIKPKN